MRKLLFLLLLVSGIASAQYQPTTSKTRFVNGIGLGTKDTTGYTGADTLVIIMGKDSIPYFRYKGYWKPISIGASGTFKSAGDSLYNSGYARRDRVKQGLDSVAALIPNVSGYKLISDTSFNNGYTTRARLKQYGDSLGLSELNIADTLAMLNNRISSIVLNNTGAIHNTPSTFVRSGGTWTATQTLATQSAFTAFARGSGSGTPSFQSLDTTFIPNFSSKVNSVSAITAQNLGGVSPIAFNTIEFDTSTGIRMDSIGIKKIRVKLGSSFKTWKVSGQTSLVAVGEDSLTFIALKGINLNTDNTLGNKKFAFTTDSTVVPFIEDKGINLFDYSKAYIGAFQDNAGAVTVNTGFGISDFIPVNLGDTIFLSNNAGSTQIARFSTLYNSSKAVISGGLNTATFRVIASTSGVAFIKFSFPIDAFYKTIVAYKGALNNPGSAIPLPYLGTTIKPYAKVDVANTKFITPSVNLFNKYTATDGYFLTNTNTVTTSSIYGISDYIPVTPGVTYVASNGLVPSAIMRFTTYFDSSYRYVAGGSSSGVNAFICPTGVAYVRVTYDNNSSLTNIPPVGKNTFQFQVGVSSTDYKQFSRNFDTYLNTMDSMNVTMWGFDRLRKWNAWKQQQDYRYDLVLTGDSYTDGNYFGKKFYDLLQTQGLPYGGAGFCSFLSGDGPLNGVSIDSTKFKANWATGAWTNLTYAPNGTTSWAPAGNSVKATGASSIITLTAGETYDSIKVIYFMRSGGGSFQWKINAGSNTSVSTANGSNAVGILTIPTNGVSAPFTITLTAGDNTIEFGGAIARRNGNLLNVHKVGLTGSNASMFAQNSLFNSSITPLSAKGIVLMWATNEQNASIVPSVMKQYVQRIANYYRGQDSLCDLIFMAPMATKYDGARAYRSSEYANVMFQLAQENNGAFIDFNKIFGAFSQQQINNQMIAGDSVHPGARGSFVYSQTMLKGFAPYISGTFNTTVSAPNIQTTGTSIGSTSFTIGSTLGAINSIGQTVSNNYTTNVTSSMTDFNIQTTSDNGARTTTNHYSAKINDIIKGTSHNITNSYGLIIGDIVSGTNDWAIQTGLGKVSFGDALTVSGTVTAPQYSSTVQTLTDGATITYNANNGSNAVVTLGGNRTLAFSNVVAGTYYTLRVIQDGTGSRTLAMPSGSKVIGGGAGVVTLSTTAAAVDLLTFYYDGTNYWVTYGTNYN
jgi:hypothetical protein